MTAYFFIRVFSATFLVQSDWTEKSPKNRQFYTQLPFTAYMLCIHADWLILLHSLTLFEPRLNQKSRRKSVPLHYRVNDVEIWSHTYYHILAIGTFMSMVNCTLLTRPQIFPTKVGRNFQNWTFINVQNPKKRRRILQKNRVHSYTG